ncbi:hypothetical protein, partial [Fictibacillus aquaticus]|uniref:hypothetical protein n=1 Tax=Fictibacillus aquaticus TaxID=2021314 RepID=UPI00197A7926
AARPKGSHLSHSSRWISKAAQQDIARRKCELHFRGVGTLHSNQPNQGCLRKKKNLIYPDENNIFM